ncbi:hypothetical protein EZV62_003137 [Acer yangbiense]|uniref:Uncharacterized protein n=1 Tax=Acer yangbiense TaxID=1000413 RepID=A0A5C7IHK4_9ROSI|nr:hypothetical protein EZV62_003137 [Acer yangbiense]
MSQPRRLKPTKPSLPAVDLLFSFSLGSGSWRRRGRSREIDSMDFGFWILGFRNFGLLLWELDLASFKTKRFFSLGFQESNEGQDFTPVLSSSGTDPKSSSKKKGSSITIPAELLVENGSRVNSGYLSTSVLPFILHLGFMTATAFFVMHVQHTFFLEVYSFPISTHLLDKASIWCLVFDIQIESFSLGDKFLPFFSALPEI